MTQQYLFNLRPPEDPVDTVVRPNVWLLSSEEIPPLLFNVDEAARILGLGRHKVFDLIRQGALRSVKVGKSRRVSARALADYVIEQERAVSR